MNHDTALAAFVRGGSDPAAVAQLRRIFADPALDRPHGLTAAQLHEFTYRRLHRVGAEVGSGTELLADRRRLCDLLAWAAMRDPALFHAMLLHYCLCLNGVARFGADSDRQIDDFETQSTVGVLFMTEAGRSGSHGSIRTEARFDPATGEFVLHSPDPAAVKFPTATAHPQVAKTALVYARLLVDDADCGVFCFVLRLNGSHGIPGGVLVRPAPEVGGLASDFAAVTFDHVRLPFEAWLRDAADISAEGVFTDPLASSDQRLRRSMSVGAEVWAALVAASGGIARAACTMAIRYSRTRITADRLSAGGPLIDYRSQHVELLSGLADTYALTALANHVKGTDPERTAEATSSWVPWSAVDPMLPLFKVAATETASRVAASCRERCGALAYVGTTLLLDYQNAAHAYLSAGGDNTLVRFDTARNMAAGSAYEPPEDRPPTALRTPADFMRLARACESRLHTRLVERLAAARTSGAGEFDVWNGQLALAVETADAYVDRVVMELFASSTAVVSNEGSRELLDHLVVLHGAAWMKRRAASLLRCGLVAAADLDAVEDVVASACDALLPHATDLVDAFDIDEDLLGTFMAADDYLAAFTAQFGLVS